MMRTRKKRTRMTKTNRRMVRKVGVDLLEKGEED